MRTTYDLYLLSFAAAATRGEVFSILFGLPDYLESMAQPQAAAAIAIGVGHGLSVALDPDPATPLSCMPHARPAFEAVLQLLEHGIKPESDDPPASNRVGSYAANSDTPADGGTGSYAMTSPRSGDAASANERTTEFGAGPEGGRS